MRIVELVRVLSALLILSSHTHTHTRICNIKCGKSATRTIAVPDLVLQIKKQIKCTTLLHTSKFL